MADHLRERQVGLGHGDVAPHLLGQLVGGAGALVDQLAQLLGAPAVHGEALVDQGDVIGDRLAVAGEQDLCRQLARAPQRLRGS